MEETLTMREVGVRRGRMERHIWALVRKVREEKIDRKTRRSLLKAKVT